MDFDLKVILSSTLLMITLIYSSHILNFRINDPCSPKNLKESRTIILIAVLGFLGTVVTVLTTTIILADASIRIAAGIIFCHTLINGLLIIMQGIPRLSFLFYLVLCNVS